MAAPDEQRRRAAVRSAIADAAMLLICVVVAVVTSGKLATSAWVLSGFAALWTFQDIVKWWVVATGRWESERHWPDESTLQRWRRVRQAHSAEPQ